MRKKKVKKEVVSALKCTLCAISTFYLVYKLGFFVALAITSIVVLFSTTSIDQSFEIIKSQAVYQETINQVMDEDINSIKDQQQQLNREVLRIINQQNGFIRRFRNAEKEIEQLKGWPII